MLPPEAFKAIVPVLIVIALVLVLVGPRLQRRAGGALARTRPGRAWHALGCSGVGVFVAGAYGGYFGAAQGVLLMGIFSALSSEPLQRLNALQERAQRDRQRRRRGHLRPRSRAARSTGGSCCSSPSARSSAGVVGARVGRRIPPAALRGLIVVIGVVAIVKLVFFP